MQQSPRSISRSAHRGMAAVLLSVCLAPAVQGQVERFRYQPDKIGVGKVYHYVKSNVDGANPVDVFLYLAAKDRIEQLGLQPGGQGGALMTGTMDWSAFSLGSFQWWHLEPGTKQLIAIVEGLPREKAIRAEVIPSGRPAETIAVPVFPWHVYGLDLASLNAAFRHLADPEGSFTLGLTDPVFEPAQPVFRYDGPVTVSYVGTEDRGGVPCRKYKIDGEGVEGKGGHIWVSRAEGHIQDLEIARPNNPERQSFKLALKGVETRDRAGWDRLVSERIGPATAAGPVEAVTSPPKPCRVPGLEEEVECATYAVWEDREARKGRKIGLNVVILPALGKDPVPDPIFFFGGGPGEGITIAAAGLAGEEEIRKKRDIVLVDQRGTGRSNPLDCTLYGEPVDFRRAAGEVFPLDEVRKCRERLEKVADLRLYTTDLAMDDVNEVRAWLGYGKINLNGGSYGTRAAQVYLRRHPETVRTAVLTAVAPVDLYLPLRHAYAGQRALDLLLAECAENAACKAKFPKVKEELNAVMDRVRKGVKVTVTNTRTGERQEVQPTHGLVAEGIRFLMYGQGGNSLPFQIHRAYEGDLAPLVQMAIERRLAIDEVLAMGLLFSITCAEDLPYITEEMTVRETRGTLLGDYRISQQKAVCGVWPRAKVPADVHELVRSDVPVFLISGERDPVTPPELGDKVAAQLPNSLHIVVPRGSHGGAGECTENMVRQFVDQASVQGIDTSCLQKLPKTEFMTGSR